MILYNDFITILAFDLTGGYYNPTLATGLKLGCLMEDETAHVLVRPTSVTSEKLL
jgi:hypothetical protein